MMIDVTLLFCLKDQTIIDKDQHQHQLKCCYLFVPRCSVLFFSVLFIIMVIVIVIVIIIIIITTTTITIIIIYSTQMGGGIFVFLESGWWRSFDWWIAASFRPTNVSNLSRGSTNHHASQKCSNQLSSLLQNPDWLMIVWCYTLW